MALRALTAGRTVCCSRLGIVKRFIGFSRHSGRLKNGGGN
ncbi:hypothetical protein l13_16950 [Neisseria weaveri ATCC 51223]|nr:hypothetical protein l13_16950 [Neisseria weaveri ATCC 51223]